MAAAAQFSNAMSATTPTGSSTSYAGLGDVVGSALGYYGLRAYNAATAAAGTQAVMNVHRTSDSHTCDILVATTGGLGNTANCSTGGDNGQSLSAFLSSTTGTVDELYNQSGGSACNLTQSTVANQPKISLSPLALVFDSTPRFFACAMTAVATPISYAGAFEPIGNSSALHLSFVFHHVEINTSNITGWYQVWNDAAATGGNANKPQANGGTGGSFGTGSLAAATTANNIAAVAAVFTSTSSRLDYLAAVAGAADTSTINPTAQNTLEMGQLYLGTSGNSRYLNGYVFEFGYWGSALTSGNVTSMCHQEYLYGWSTTSC